ncbi:MAG: cytochrome c [Alphaproteobacteria bacterium]|nr:cytochrome c [Alphaproteobacteria bacterium]
MWRPSLAALALIVPLVAAAAEIEPTPRRQKEILHLFKHDCGSCHGLTRKGGLGPPLMPEAIAEIDDEVLIDAVIFGRAGTPMAPWGIDLNREEAAWLIRRLKRGNIDG